MLKLEEDKDMPMIFGRPFLATERELIDVQKGELKLGVEKEEANARCSQLFTFRNAPELKY